MKLFEGRLSAEAWPAYPAFSPAACSSRPGRDVVGGPVPATPSVPCGVKGIRAVGKSLQHLRQRRLALGQLDEGVRRRHQINHLGDLLRRQAPPRPPPPGSTRPALRLIFSSSPDRARRRRGPGQAPTLPLRWRPVAAASVSRKVFSTSNIAGSCNNFCNALAYSSNCFGQRRRLRARGGIGFVPPSPPRCAPVPPGA